MTTVLRPFAAGVMGIVIELGGVVTAGDLVRGVVIAGDSGISGLGREGVSVLAKSCWSCGASAISASSGKEKSNAILLGLLRTNFSAFVKAAGVNTNSTPSSLR